MNSSKSAQPIMTAFNHEQQGKNFVIVKSAKDTRDNKVKSRALKMEMDCIPIVHFSDLLQIAMKQKPDWLFVDEAQFLTADMVDTLGLLVDDFNIQVICYGLLTDFQSKLFEGSLRLMESADNRHEIINQCIYCENKANRNMRVVQDVPIFEGESIQPGGNEMYMSVCRKCYNARKRNSEGKVGGY